MSFPLFLIHTHIYIYIHTHTQMATVDQEINETLSNLHKWMQPEEVPTPAWLVPARRCVCIYVCVCICIWTVCLPLPHDFRS
jgi:hypothetical protein